MQKRSAAFARMGAVVFAYDMIGYGDSKQVDHKIPIALTIQTYNSQRVIDYLQSRPDVDPEKIAVTGESGGGTQTFLLAALDPRVTVTAPVVMVSAAGSTLDSTFSSLAKLAGRELPLLAGRDLGQKAIGVGMAVMVLFALLGNLPMIAGTDILKATTISGTMVIGLAPIFVLHGLTTPTRLGFHLSFWTGLGLGVALTLNWIPQSWAIGTGKYALLLGTNLYGLGLCVLGYLLPGWLRRTA